MATFLKRPLLFASLVSLLAFMIVAMAIWEFQRIRRSQFVQKQRNDVIGELATIRGEIEKAVNKRLVINSALKAHVAVTPEIDIAQFADFSSILTKDIEGVRSTTGIRNGVITHVYPLEKNRSAIGKNLFEEPDQKGALEHAIQIKKATLVGPVDLVQGGVAFICREPVTIPETKKLWGLVSVLIDKDVLERDIYSNVPEQMSIAIRGIGDQKQSGEIIFGDEAIAVQSPITTTISLSTGNWELYGVPKDGWAVQLPGETSQTIAGFVFALAVGVITFAITILVVADSEQSGEVTAEENEGKRFSRHRISVGIPVAVTLLGTFVAYNSLRNEESRRIKIEVNNKAANVISDINERFRIFTEVVQGIGSYQRGSQSITRDEFRRFVERSLKIHRGIQALEWVPRVRRVDRERFEQAAREGGFPEFQFKVWNDREGFWEATANDWAEDYFPVYFMEPLVGNEPALGIDLSSNPQRNAALQLALKTGRPAATAAVTLAQGRGDQGVLVFSPVYREGDHPGASRDDLIGFGLGVFQVNDLIASSLERREISGLELTVRDPQGSDSGGVLFQSSGVDKARKQPGHTLLVAEQIAGRPWEFQFDVSADYINSRRTTQPLFVLGSGVLVAFLLGLSLSMLLGRTQRIERVVQMRTTELRAAETRLKQEREETELILDSIPSLVFFKDQKNNILRVNRAAAQSLEMAKSEIEGRNAREFYPHDADRFFEDDLAVMRSGQPKIGYIQPYGDRVGRTDKIPIPSQNGNIDHILVILTDITEQKRAEELIQKSFDASTTGLLLVNDRRQAVMANRSVLQMFGYAHESMIGLDINTLLPERFHDLHAEEFESFVKSPDDRLMGTNREVLAVNSAGHEFHVEIGLTPVETEDGLHVLASIVDLEERLREEQERLKMKELLEKTSRMAKVGGWELELNSKKPVWSEEVCRIHECPVGHQPDLDEAIGYYTDESRVIIEQAVSRAIDEHEPWDLQLTINSAKGNRVWVRTIGQPEIVNGKCVRLWGTFQDITDRLQAESERDKFFDMSLDLFCQASLDGYFRRLNSGWTEKLGYSSDELMERPFFDFVHPDDRLATEIVMRHLIDGMPVSGFTNRYLRKDGTALWLEWTASPPEDGLVYAVARDVTESKETEAELKRLNEELGDRALELARRSNEAEIARRQSEETRSQLETALVGANLGLWDWNATTNEVYYSPTFKSQLGYDAGDLWENTFEDWRSRLHPEDRESALARVEEYLAHQTGEYKSTFRLRCKDGSYRWILSQGKAEFDNDGKPLRIVGVHVDITERTQMQELLERMSEMAQVGAWELDLNTMMPIWSDEVCRIHEVPLGHQPSLDEAVSYYSEESRPFIETAVQCALDDNLPWDMELSLITAKGNQVWVRAVGQPVIEDGKCIRLWGTFQDVTQRKRAEMQLKLTQRVVDYSTDSVLFMTADGKVTYANEQAAVDFGYERNQFLQMQIHELGSRFSKEQWPELWDQVLAAGHMIFETKMVRKNGQSFDCELRASFHEYQENQILVFAIRDITQSKRDAELRNVLFERSTNAHLLFDESGIIECNNAAVQMLRLEDKKAVFSRHPAELSPERQPDGRRSDEKSIEMDSIARNEGYHRFEWIHTRADGNEFPVEVTLNPVEIDEGQAMLVEWHDLTDQKRQEILLKEKNQELEQFLYIVSHDLKSPLVTVEGFAGMAQRDMQEGKLEKAIERLDRVTKACKRMGRLINDLLELSRMNRARLDCRECQLDAIITDVIDTLAVPIRRANANVIYSETSQTLMADESLLEQILQNLIENALKYGCPEPEMEIRIQAREIQGALEIRIEDDGPGIPAEYHERIFKPFDRLSNDKQGSGLGLAIVARAAQHHAGEVWVDSERTSGTTFVLRLPLVTADATWR